MIADDLVEPAAPTASAAVRVLHSPDLVANIVRRGLAQCSDRVALMRVCKAIRNALHEDSSLWRAIVILQSQSPANLAAESAQQPHQMHQPRWMHVVSSTETMVHFARQVGALCEWPCCRHVESISWDNLYTVRTVHLPETLNYEARELETTEGSLVRLDCLAKFDRLVELSIVGSLVSAPILHRSFTACGRTLRRLDVSDVFYSTQDVVCTYLFDGDDGYQKACADRSGCRALGWLFADPDGPDFLDLFAPLGELRTLVAQGVDRPRKRRIPGCAIPLTGSSILDQVQQHCALLEVLVLGWRSEFQRKASPDDPTEFSKPFVASPVLSGRLASLRDLRLCGYALMMSSGLLALGTPPIVTLDLTTAGAAFPQAEIYYDERISGRVLADALRPLAPTLANLNVRGTAFDDDSAVALAEGGANLARLNASCTPLTGLGLAVLSEASLRLVVLDLCYSEAICTRDVLAVTARHTALEMLGLGGFTDLTDSALCQMLAGGACQHLGIGGCSALDGAEIFRQLGSLCPSLTALNAHRLPHVDGRTIEHLLRCVPSLTSLDVHGCDVDLEGYHEWYGGDDPFSSDVRHRLAKDVSLFEQPRVLQAGRHDEACVVGLKSRPDEFGLGVE